MYNLLTQTNNSYGSENQALRKFSEAARIKYLTNDNNKVINCQFESKISEFDEKEIMIKMTAIFKFYISEIIKFLSATSDIFKF